MHPARMARGASAPGGVACQERHSRRECVHPEGARARRGADRCHAVLRQSIYHTIAAATNTGDGQIMGMEIGAELIGMSNNVGCSCFITDIEEAKVNLLRNPLLQDNCDYCGKPGAIVVNSKGRR